MTRAFESQKIASPPRDGGRGVRAAGRWSRVAVPLLVAVGLTMALAARPAVARVMPLPEVPEGARASTVLEGGEPRVEARLLTWESEDDADSLRAGVLFDVAPGWHIYWRYPGESGLPTQVEWEIEEGEAGPIAWPAPQSFEEAEGFFTTYGYSGRVLLSSGVRFGRNAPSQPEVAVRVSLLACKQECIPGELRLSRRIARNGDAIALEEAAAIEVVFEQELARVPRLSSELGLEERAYFSLSAIRPGDGFEAGLVYRCAPSSPEPCRRMTQSRSVTFFGVDGDFAEIEAGGVRRAPGKDDRLVVELAGRAYEAVAGQEALLQPSSGERTGGRRLSGVLRFDGGDGEGLALEVDVAMPTAPAGAEVTVLGVAWFDADGQQDPSAGPARDVGFLSALLLAFAGGLLLNLMPCVLPVLAIKVFSVAELARRSRREVLAHGAAYTAGILSTLLVLAVAVLALREAGRMVGWGFQFQEPLFVAAVATVVVAFALNLLGVFEITPDTGGLAQVGQGSSGLRRSFFDGLLGVVLATPCSAPFLGTAVGFAFASPGYRIVGIFMSIGLGLAAPLVVVSLVPAAARWIPRSGAWMNRLRVGLAFPLFATAVWLLWVFGRLTDIDGMVALAGFLVAMSFVLWLFGLMQSSGKRAVGVAGLALVALVMVSGLGSVARVAESDGLASAKSAGSAEASWQAFDSVQIASQLSEGRPVFVVFTADWCITCKVNERVVLSDDRVREELAKLGVASFKADWTRPNEAIRTELARFGKAGVPLYLVYDPEHPARPRLLPEVLTVDLVVEALRDAAASTVSL